MSSSVELLFALSGAFHYWFLKMLSPGKMYSETSGKLHFWLFVIGFHPHVRQYAHSRNIGHAAENSGTVRTGRGWDTWNPTCSNDGVAFSAALSLVSLLGNLVWVLSKWRNCRERSPTHGFEWSISSPPPAYNFATILPK